MKAPFKINPNPKTVNDICGEDHELKKLHGPVYTVTVLKRCSRMERKKSYIVKIYNEFKCIQTETENLQKLDKVRGVPKLYYSSILNLEDGKDDGKPDRKPIKNGWVYPSLYFTVIERVPALDLFDIQKTARYPIDKLRGIFRQVLVLLIEIHKRGIIHQDIKEENILYNEEKDRVYLIDFEGKKTLLNQSPEQAEELKLTEKTDIWSLGTALYSSITGYELVGNVSDILLKPIDKMLHRLDKNLPESLFDLFECILDRNPVTRYSASECLSHEFFQEV